MNTEEAQRQRQKYYKKLWEDVGSGLRQQALRRIQRAEAKAKRQQLVVDQVAAIERNISKRSGSFEAFQHQLTWERQMKARELQEKEGLSCHS